MTFSHQLKKGFTLIELLVVIAILGALAGVSYPLIMSMIENGNITAANKTCKDIVAGIQSYKDDNGGIPVNWDKVDDEAAEIVVLTTNGEDDADFVHIMFNTEVGKDVANTNKEYIKADSVNEMMNGLYEDGDVAGLYDPWGEPYYVFIRSEADGSLVDPFTNSILRNQWCIAYSTGGDKLGKHHDIEQPRGGKASKKKGKKDKKKKAAEEEPLRYPDYTEEEQEQISDNVYSWKKVDE